MSLETKHLLKASQLHYCPHDDAKSMVKHLIFLRKFAVLSKKQILFPCCHCNRKFWDICVGSLKFYDLLGGVKIGNVTACALSVLIEETSRLALGLKKTVKNRKSKSPNRWKLAITPPFFRRRITDPPSLVRHRPTGFQQSSTVKCCIIRGVSTPNFRILLRPNVWE